MPKRTSKRTRRASEAKPEHGAKAEFVRAHPGVPAGELVTLASRAGLPITVGHIYNIRSKEKARGTENGSATATATATNGARSNAPTNGGGSEEGALRSLIIRMGLDRAEAVFGGLRAQLKTLGV